jgi:hypothetical protein
VVVLQPGFPPAAMANDVRLQLEAQGMLGNRVWIEDPLVAGGLVEVLQLERNVAGEPIEGAELWLDPNARFLVPTIGGAGVTPVFGASEYGQETPAFPGGRPWSLVFGQPQLGGLFNVIHETWVPNTIAVEALSLAEAPLPLPVFGGWLLVDPAAMVLELTWTDVNGRMQRPWPIPPNPLLFGFELHSQGIAFQPPGLADAFSTGVRCVIGQ